MAKQLPDAQNVQEVETAMRELLRQSGAEGLKQHLERKDKEYPQEKELTGECGGKLAYMFRREAVILSVFGRVSYKRRYFLCSKCKQGISPLDHPMNLAAGEVTAGLAELLALAGIQTSFAESRRLIERFLLFSVSDNTIRNETDCFGALQKVREAAWIQQSQDEDWLQAHLQNTVKLAGR